MLYINVNNGGGGGKNCLNTKECVVIVYIEVQRPKVFTYLNGLYNTRIPF